ncbi:MAG: hypothetical protein ACPHEN_07525, partial [Candidatus Poseidoniaceae archaeon]
MASGRYANTNKSLLLVTLMILMTQVGYLENLNPWISGEEALDSNNEVAQSSAGTSVMYGNNTQWAPQGPMSTNSIYGNDIIAVSDEVILFQHSGGSTTDCLGAYNRYNETSWTPTFATPSGNACSSGTFEFLGMIGDITLFTFDEHSDQYRGDSIYAYNLANDTAYRVFESPALTYPAYSSFAGRAVMIGNSVYMAEYHSPSPSEYKLGVFNFDNQSHWTYDSILSSDCSDQIHNLVVVSETKLLLSCDASWGYSHYVFNIENESMYLVNGLNGSTLSESLVTPTIALVGTKLLFDASTCFTCKSNPWVFDATNDTAWVVIQDVMPDANTGFIMNNMMRSGTSVLFTGYGYNYSTSSVLQTNLYWYESTNDTIWQATFFTDSALTMNGRHGELANGDIVFITTSGSNAATYFHNPANGSVWEEEALCYGTYGSDCGEFVLIEVYGNTIFGTAKMNRTGSPFGWDSMIAYDFSNKSTQVSWNLGNAPSPQSNMVYSQGFALGDQLLFPYRCAQSTSTTCARVNNGTSTSNDATMIWSPYAIRVSDAWNMSKGEIEGAYDPISG